MHAGRADARIRVDGRFDEPAWATADSIGALTQIEPHEGAVPTGRTVVRILSDPGAIVFGIRADDPDPAGIVAFARERDASLASEDHIKLVLDTYLDGRSGYVFVVNPNGARYDALVTDQGEGENASWDAVWEAATARTPSGWTAEIRIPAKSLLFRPGLTSWGFNVQRRIQRLQETDRWASPDRDVKINLTSRAGLLTGVPPLALGAGLSIRPSATTGTGVPAPSAPAEHQADASLDVTQRLGANTLASLTVNADFAETEVDTRRTNLTRFPLSFPEKRTFFLEGADIFDFGLGTGTDVRPFFSRRVGLLSGREVPLVAGFKVNGRQAGTNFGALAVRTGRLDSLPTANTMAAVRIRQNVLGESSVGMIATAGDPLGTGGSWLAGPDLTYQTSHFRGDKNFLAGVWGLAMGRQGIGGGTSAVGFKVDYPNDLWDIAFTGRRVDAGFQPSIGFVPRPGIYALNLNINFSPRPRRPLLGLRVRQMTHESLNSLVTDLSGRWESYRIFTAPINWRFESGDRFEFNANPTGERLAQPSEIAGVLVPAGGYHWVRYRLEAGFATKRRVSGQVTWWFGRFYSGNLHELILTVSIKPSATFIMDLNATRNSGRLPQGDISQTLVGARFRVNLSPDLQFNSYLQYDNDTRRVGSNSRLRWTFAPQGEAFVVYHHNINELQDPSGRHQDWQFASNQLLVKVQYAFRY